MARKKKRGRSKRPRQSILAWGAAGSLVAPAVPIVTGAGSMQDKVNTLLALYTGHDGQNWRFDLLTRTYGRPAVLLAIKKGLSMMGIRMPKGVPFNF